MVLRGDADRTRGNRRLYQSRVAASFSNPPKCDGAGDRARSRSYRAAVVAAMNDPLAVGRPSGDHSDVVRPYDHDPKTGATGIPAFPGPLSRQRQARVGLSKIPAHVSPAPGVCPVRMMIPVMVMSVMTGVGIAGKCAHQSCRKDDGL